MTKIGTEFEVSYAHRIKDHLGKCANLHGHNGKVRIELEASLNPDSGMVADFSLLKGYFKEWVVRHFDHTTILQEGDPLVEVVGGRLVVVSHPPTAEMLSNIILWDKVVEDVGKVSDVLGLLSASVRFWETEDCYAEAHHEPSNPLLNGRPFPWYWDMR